MLSRATVRDPDFVHRLGSGEITASDCNCCIAAMDAGGVTCVSAVKGLLQD
jgi:hypothetical protein